MPPSARARLLLSSVLGLLMFFPLKTPAVSTAPTTAWETRTARSVSRRTDGGHGGARGDERPWVPPSSRALELDAPPEKASIAPPPAENSVVGTSGAVPRPETAALASADDQSIVVTAPAESGGCWIFMHLQKCGGSTVKKMLKDSWGDRYFVYDSMRWKFGDEFSRKFGEKLASGHPWNVMAGGYPEALRRAHDVNANCRFFTVFRHPIARLVSAYFYCQNSEKDVACASNIVRARDVDLLTFAKHWGNFAVRQFALSMVPADDVMAYARTPEARVLLPESVESVDDVAGWYLLKMYLERPEAEGEGGASGRQQPYLETSDVEVRIEEKAEEGEKEEDEKILDAQMYDFLEPAQALLSDRYTAVGILESWNTTLSLFDAALGMPEMDWQRGFRQEGKQNVDVRFQELKEETLESAWTDPELRKYLRLDLVLYKHATDVFHRQARSRGLLVPE